MFEIITVDELIKRVSRYNHAELHIHHTWRPNHEIYASRPDGVYWNQAMASFHINTNGWSDIAQHVTLLPDGRFATGRPFGQTPASITGYNTGAFAVEMIGDFDIGKDVLEGKQRESALALARWFDSRGKYIRFHNENSSKSCPGTSINKVQFMSEVKGDSEMLQKGDRNDEVKAWQGKLIKLGYDLGKFGADGDFGGATQKAVEGFQRANSLPINGALDLRTMVAVEVKGLNVDGLKKEIATLKDRLSRIKLIMEGWL